MKDIGYYILITIGWVLVIATFPIWVIIFVIRDANNKLWVYKQLKRLEDISS